MATLTECAEAIKAAIKAAESQGYRLEYWPWVGEESLDLTVNLTEWRKVNGVMTAMDRRRVLEVEGI